MYLQDNHVKTHLFIPSLTYPVTECLDSFTTNDLLHTTVGSNPTGVWILSCDVRVLFQLAYETSTRVSAR